MHHRFFAWIGLLVLISGSASAAPAAAAETVSTEKCHIHNGHCHKRDLASTSVYTLTTATTNAQDVDLAEDSDDAHGLYRYYGGRYRGGGYYRGGYGRGRYYRRGDITSNEGFSDINVAAADANEDVASLEHIDDGKDNAHELYRYGGGHYGGRYGGGYYGGGYYGGGRGRYYKREDIAANEASSDTNMADYDTHVGDHDEIEHSLYRKGWGKGWGKGWKGHY